MSLLDKLDPKMGSHINDLADICKPVVERIESLPMTTQNHYGDYMVAITTVANAAEKAGFKREKPDEQRLIYLAIGIALQRAGGNKAGIQSAVRALGAL